MKNFLITFWSLKREFSILVIIVYLIHALMYYPEIGLIEIFIAVLIANLILFILVYLMVNKFIN
jgi:hypothetical protein